MGHKFVETVLDYAGLAEPAGVAAYDEGYEEDYGASPDGGEDVVTLMLYLCGSDLESEGAAATTDLEEIVADNTSDKLGAGGNGGHRGNRVPLRDGGFADSYFDAANELIAESDAVLARGQEDNKNGDSFGLVSVIYSAVLFAACGGDETELPDEDRGTAADGDCDNTGEG